MRITVNGQIRDPARVGYNDAMNFAQFGHLIARGATIVPYELIFDRQEFLDRFSTIYRKICEDIRK